MESSTSVLDLLEGVQGSTLQVWLLRASFLQRPKQICRTGFLGRIEVQPQLSYMLNYNQLIRRPI